MITDITEESNEEKFVYLSGCGPGNYYRVHCLGHELNTQIIYICDRQTHFAYVCFFYRNDILYRSKSLDTSYFNDVKFEPVNVDMALTVKSLV